MRRSEIHPEKCGQYQELYNEKKDYVRDLAILELFWLKLWEAGLGRFDANEPRTKPPSSFLFPD